MTDRRETSRRLRRTRSQSKKHKQPPAWQEGERIAKFLARAGIASRREVEAMIERGEVEVNGKVLRTPAFKIFGREDIQVKGQRVGKHEHVRVWRYHKPAGLITTTKDPEGRRTIFDELSKSLPRTITIGRLDLTTEGLLLLTNDGGLARAMELPKTGFRRVYRARAHGKITQAELNILASGMVTDDGTRFAEIKATLDRQTGSNNWITVELLEGKNREVRKALEHLGLKVNRLIRTEYGPFILGDLRPGAVEEIPADVLHRELSGQVLEKHLPIGNIKPPSRQKRHSEKKSYR